MLKQVKLVVLSFLMILQLAVLPVFADDNSFITSLEQQMFGTSYAEQTVNQRLDRLENVILGQTQQKDPENVRVQRLKSLLDSQNSNETTLNQPSSREEVTLPYKNDYSQVQEPEHQTYSYDGPEVDDYPAVSYLEEKVFKKTYKGEDITKRLERLEQNVFNQTRPNQGLSERVDNLKMAITGNTQLPVPKLGEDEPLAYGDRGSFSYSNQNYPSQNNYDPRINQKMDPRDFQQDYNFPDYNNMGSVQDDGTLATNQTSFESLNQITARLEEQVLGQNYSGDNINTRLDRLEMHVFNKTSQNMSPQDRIERLVSVSAAENTSDPNDLRNVNRLRKVQTGLTVGGLLFSILSGLLF